MQGLKGIRPNSPRVEAVRNALAAEGVLRLSVAHFLIALVLLLVATPFVIETRNGVLIEGALLTLVLLSAVLAVGGRRRTLVTAVVLVTPPLAGTWVNHFQLDVIPKEFTLVGAIVFMAFVIVRLLGFILRAPRVDSEVLCAAIATYLMLGLLWAFAYELVARLTPAAFSFTAAGDLKQPMAGFEALYFSFTTLTTVGYGDITPASRVARMLAMAEATTGTFFVTVLIARLVALYSAGAGRGRATQEGDIMR